MFRRKEDSLFDNTTDPNQPEDTESTTVTKPTSGNTPSGSSSSYTSSQPTVQSNRPTADTSRPASASNNTFRPAASPLSSNDTSRNRTPEAKPGSSAPAASVTVGTAAKSNPNRRVLTVGNDILLKGEIATCDRLVIEGKVDATLNDVHTVEIAESGSFKGSARIEDAEISGVFEGDLIVRNRLVIYATGKVRGTITYGEIEIERGGEFTGEIKTVDSDSNAKPARSKKEKEAA